jgi:hypothetical protein
MFHLSYYKYILTVLKNTLCPDIDNTLYNPHIEHIINKKSHKKKSGFEKNITILFFSSYEYLNIYVNDYIKYFCLDTSLYMRLNRYYKVVNI